MEKKLKELQKAVEELRNYNTDIDGYSDSQYVDYRADIHENIDLALGLPKEIRRIGNEVEDSKKDLILEKLDDLDREGKDLISSIEEKEQRFNRVEEETIVKCQAQVRELSLQLSSLISKKDNLKKVYALMPEYKKINRTNEINDCKYRIKVFLHIEKE